MARPRRWLSKLLALACLGLCALAQAATVRHYDVQLEPDLQGATLQGRVVVHLAGNAGDELQLDAGALQIDAVRAQGRSLNFEKAGSRLTVLLPASAVTPVEIDFHGRPAAGMKFLPAQRQLYTAFSTSQWMPCLDAPDQRATLTLSLLLPGDLKVAATGRLLRSENRPNGKTLTVWATDSPVPSYLFGFAAGPFREVIDDDGEPTLRVLAPPEFSDDDLRRIFADTRHMMAFYEQKSGVPYPGATYTQVLVSSAAAQELAGMAVMGQNYGRRVLADAKGTWLGAHELSHQWWGNAVTNRAWTEFWLNEGIATFMNAAWFEARWGRGEYMLHIDAARTSYEKIRDAGADKPLRFAHWNAPSAQDRSLVYDKGAHVVHLLRELMGEAAFWRGLKIYTRQHWGRAMTSRDFQAAMQSTSSVDLAPFFAQWIYGAP